MTAKGNLVITHTESSGLVTALFYSNRRAESGILRKVPQVYRRDLSVAERWKLELKLESRTCVHAAVNLNTEMVLGAAK